MALGIAAISFYLMIPSSIPFIKPAHSLIEKVRLVNFTIGVLVAIFLYANEFTLMESIFVGTFWSAYLTYLLIA